MKEKRYGCLTMYTDIYVSRKRRDTKHYIKTKRTGREDLIISGTLFLSLNIRNIVLNREHITRRVSPSRQSGKAITLHIPSKRLLRIRPVRQ